MVNKNQAVLGLISLVVLASGCTQGGNTSEVTTTQNQGLTVQSFSVFPNPMLSGTTGDLTLRLQNTGGTTAENVEATVYNVPWSGGEEPGDQQWGNGQGENNPTINFPELSSPDPERGIPSTAVERILTISAPAGDSGIDSDYEFMTDIVYDYNTSAEAQVTVMGEERYRDERPTRGRPDVENTGAPIQIDIRTETPIITRDTDTTQQVCFVVNNVGGGTPELQDPGDEVDDAENKVDLTVSIPDEGIVVDENVEISRQTDRGGECADIGGDISDPTQQVSYPIEATAEYTYERTERTSVTVEDTG